MTFLCAPLAFFAWPFEACFIEPFLENPFVAGCSDELTILFEDRIDATLPEELSAWEEESSSSSSGNCDLRRFVRRGRGVST